MRPVPGFMILKCAMCPIKEGGPPILNMLGLAKAVSNENAISSTQKGLCPKVMIVSSDDPDLSAIKL